MLGVLPNQNSRRNAKAAIILPEKWFVTNTLTGKSYGETKKIPIDDLKRGNPLIFDLSPVSIGGVTVEFASRPMREK